MSHHKKDYIGPTISPKKKLGVVPEGPTAEFSSKPSKGMGAAKNLFKGEPPKLEGTPVAKPLPVGPPTPLPPGSSKEDAVIPKVRAEFKTVDGKVLSPEQVMGNSHIASYQTLLANDRLEKPRIKAWADEDEQI